MKKVAILKVIILIAFIFTSGIIFAQQVIQLYEGTPREIQKQM